MSALLAGLQIVGVVGAVAVGYVIGRDLERARWQDRENEAFDAQVRRGGAR